MAIDAKPPADVPIDVTLVRCLLEEQCSELSRLPLADAGEGWDNRLFRLGDGMVVRLPRRAASARLIEHEQRWLPQLSRRLPLPVPVPQQIGRPGCGFPWAWSVTSWFTGESALVAPPQIDDAVATALGEFLRALHEPAPADAPCNPWRGVPLAHRTNALHEHVSRLDGAVDRRAVLAFWERALATPAWPGPPLWIHGDFHPGNLIVTGGAVTAVIDFGDLTGGDPATDLSSAWILLPSSTRSTFRDAARGSANPVDDHTWMRARAWAVALGLAHAASSRGDPAMAALGLRAVEAALTDG